MANVPAINVTDWAARLALANDSQELRWMAKVVLGTRGRANPFSGLIGGMSGMKPITEVMDFTTLQGQEIIVTLDRPLGGRGTQGAASTTKLRGREEKVRHATYRAKVGLLAHAVEGEQILKTEAVIGKDWDNRQREKLKEWFAWKQGDDIQFECIKRAHFRNTLYPNNKSSADVLGSSDYLNLQTVVLAQQLLNANQCDPFNISHTSSGEEILKYLVMGPHKAWMDIAGSSAYQNLLANADLRGADNHLFKGGLPEYFGTALYNWQVQDGTQVGPLACPLAPVAYTGSVLPAIAASTVAPTIKGGGSAINAAETDPAFFQYFPGASYVGHEGEKIAATTTQEYYLAVKVIDPSSAEVGKIAMFSYKVNNGNQITAYKRLGATATGDIVTAMGSMTYNVGAWTPTGDGSGFNGLSVGEIPIGSPCYWVNAKGQPLVRSIAMGRNMIMSGWGSIAAGAGQVPGQRLEQPEDYGRINGLGYQQVWGCRATENADNMVNGYVMIVSAWNPPGWPTIA